MGPHPFLISPVLQCYEKEAKSLVAERFPAAESGSVRSYERMMRKALKHYAASFEEAKSLKEDGDLGTQAGGSSHGAIEAMYRLHASRLKILICAVQAGPDDRNAAETEGLRLTERHWYSKPYGVDEPTDSQSGEDDGDDDNHDNSNDNNDDNNNHDAKGGKPSNQNTEKNQKVDLDDTATKDDTGDGKDTDSDKHDENGRTKPETNGGPNETSIEESTESKKEGPEKEKDEEGEKGEEDGTKDEGTDKNNKNQEEDNIKTSEEPRRKKQRRDHTLPVRAAVWRVLADVVSALAQCRLEETFFHRSVYRYAQAFMWAPALYDPTTGLSEGSTGTVPATRSHLLRGLNSSTGCAFSAEVILSPLFEKRR